MTNPRVLIVENEATVASDLESKLKKSGYIVPAIVFSGEEAIQRAAETRPDVVLMDIGLRGKVDGIETAKEISSRFDIPVIYLTGYADDATMERAKATDPFGYILKPFNTRELCSTIEMALYKHEMEKRLRESEERFQLLYEQAPLGYQSLDEEGCLVQVNQAWLDMLGYSREQVIGRRFSDFLTPQYVDLFPGRFTRFKAAGEIRGAEFEMVRRDGSHVVVSIDGRMGCDAQGDFKQTHCILYNITERRRMEEALKGRTGQIMQAKQEWEATVDSLPQLICLLDAQGRIIRANRTVETWNLGWVADVKGRGVHQLFHPNCADPSCYLQEFWSRAREEMIHGRPAECEAEDKVLNLHLWFQIRPISELRYGEDKGVTSLAVVTVDDITEQVRAKEQIQASLQEKEVLLHEIHHRIKSNLQVISSLLDLQSESVQDPQALQVLQDSQNRVQSMALVHDNLHRSQDLAGIDAIEYIQSEVDYLSTVYEGQEGTVTPRIQVDDIHLSLETAIPCGLIINELVSNALQYAFPTVADRSAGEIRIELYADERGWLTLVVGDNGVGLPPDLDWQNPPSLGLQLVNLLTRQLGGKITVDQSAGTTFKVTFAEQTPLTKVEQ